MRTGLVHDYTRRGGVVSTEIMLPDGTSAERNALWNAAELAEKRKDGRTGREWIIALPAELDEAARQELASAFGIELASRYGVAVDLAIHLPDREGDNRNHHAHVMTTTRQVSRDEVGQLVMGDKATIELSDTKRRGMGLGSGADEVVAIRQLWERMANGALEKSGSDARIDSRSLKAQGLDREATTHLGPVASDMERRQKASDRGDGNRQVAANNVLREQISAQILDLVAFRAAHAAAPAPVVNKARSAPVRLPDNPLPVYARNPRKMASVDDISKRGERLFGPLKAATEKHQVNDQVNESGADLLRPEVLAAWHSGRRPGAREIVKPADQVKTPWSPQTAKKPKSAEPAEVGKNRTPSQSPAMPATLEKTPAVPAPASGWTPGRRTVTPEAPPVIDAPVPSVKPQPRPDVRAAIQALLKESGSAQRDVGKVPAKPETSPPAPRRDEAPLTGSTKIRASIAEWKRKHGIDDQPKAEPVSPAVEPAVPAAAAAAIEVKPVISAARRELDALKAGLVPIDTLVAADPKVIKAQKEYDRIEGDVDQARRWVSEIPVKEAEWRAEHPVRAALHDKGIKKSPELEHCAQSLSSAHHTAQHGNAWLSRERRNVDMAKDSATRSAHAERRASPVMQRIEQLEAIVGAEQAATAPVSDVSRTQAPRTRSKPAPRPQRDYRPDWDRDEPGMD